MKNYFTCVNALEVFIKSIKDYDKKDLMKIINDHYIISDDMIKMILSRFYVILIEKNTTTLIEKRLILKIEKNYDNINFLRHIVCNSINTFNTILSLYQKNKILKKSQVLLIYHKGKQDILKELDPYFNFIGFETEYIRENRNFLDSSSEYISIINDNRVKLSIIFGRAYIYDIYSKNGLFKNSPLIDYEQFKKRWDNDELFKFTVLRYYICYNSVSKHIQEKMIANIIYDKPKLKCLLKINPPFILERLENKFVRLGITTKEKR